MTISEVIATGIVSFVLGLISGLVIQTVKFRYDRRLDKIRRLMPYIELVHPIFESMAIDMEHGKRLMEKNDSDELIRYLNRMAKDFESFGSWFVEFAEKGMKPELESLNYDLLSGLGGANVYFQMVKNHGAKYILENMNEIAESLTKTKQLLNEFLKS
jgi:hypothetical protein